MALAVPPEPPPARSRGDMALEEEVDAGEIAVIFKFSLC
jgi:hypothetical protein